MDRGCAILLAILILFSTGVAARAQSRQAPAPPAPFPNMFEGTPQEQAACSPDSSKFCRDAEPDQLRVLSCLQRNRAKLSKACRRVLESHGQ